MNNNNNKKYDELLPPDHKNALIDDPESTDFFKDIKYVELNLPNNNVKRKPRYLFYSTIAASLLIICLLSGTIAVFILYLSIENSSKGGADVHPL